MTTQPASAAASGLLKIGEVSGRSGVGVEALRFYESRGLIEPAARTQSGYRLYGESVFERLGFIKKAQAVGFRLDEIARIIAEARGGARPCAEVRRLASERLAELDARLAELRRYRKELKTTIDAWERTRSAKGVVCGLIEGLSDDALHPPAKGVAANRGAKRDAKRGASRRPVRKWSKRSRS